MSALSFEATIVNYYDMKYCVVIIDGAAGWPLADYKNRTSLEMAATPNLDVLAGEGMLGLARTVPDGMEPSSACACMSVLGYDPIIYYKGRSAIEAISMGVPVGPDDVVFRCNFVATRHEKMWSYCAGYISTEEAKQLIDALNEKLGDENIKFFPGTGYRHILRITGKPETLAAVTTPPHDITDKPVKGYLPQGTGSELLNELMEKSKAVLEEHYVNKVRKVTGKVPARQIWLFWGSGKIPAMPSFKEVYKLDAAMTSGVDLLRGLARMMAMEVLEIPGVTDGQDNDFAAQAEGALEALKTKDLVVIHVEAPDEAAHDGSLENKVQAIESIDREIISRLRAYKGDLKLLVMPDHPTPIEIKTHCPDPVPFLMWGNGFSPSKAAAYTEAEAKKAGILIDKGYSLMGQFVKGN
jgi:2,3-bisphosphoglycerate-independent phosphoglycerate mutase